MLPRSTLWMAVLAVAQLGCTCGTGADTLIYACGSAADCADGYVCSASGRCELAGAAGGGSGGGGLGGGGGGDADGGVDAGAGGGGGGSVPTARLAFTTPSRTVMAGVCPGAANEIRVELQDPGGAPMIAGVGGQAFTITTNSTGTASWYATPACAVPISGGAFTIPEGSSSMGLFYEDTRAGTALISLSNPSGLSNPAPQAHTFVAGPPVRLAFITPPRTLPALSCSTPATTLQTQDALGNPAPVSAALTIALGKAPPSLVGRTFATAACTGAVNTVLLGAGSSDVSVFFNADNPGTLTLTASAPGLTAATQSHTLTAADPTRLVLSSSASPAEAGACAPMRVTRQDALLRNATPSSPTVATLAALPAGLQFFSDASCTTAVTAATITAGAAFADFFVKGTTGATFAVTASATGLTGGTLNFVVLPMVRRGVCTLAAGDGAITCPVTPAIPGNDLSRTFLVFAAANGENTPSDANVRCLLLGAGSGVVVSCDRQGGGALTTDVAWQTVSFARSFANGGVSVQHLETNIGPGTPAPHTVSIPAVDPARSFVLFSSTSAGTDNAGNDLVTAQLVGPTQLRLNQSVGNFALVTGCATQVVSFAGASVLRGSVFPPNPVSQVTAPGLAPATVSRTFALFTQSQDENPPATNGAICKRKLRGVISSPSALTFTRGNGLAGPCVDNVLTELAWERVELPVGSLVQAVTVTHATDTDTGSASLATAVDLTRSVVFMAGQGTGGQASGESDYSLDDILGAVVGTPTLSSASVTVTRPLSGLGAATFTPFVVQFVP